jgi:hypothetical protein
MVFLVLDESCTAPFKDTRIRRRLDFSASTCGAASGACGAESHRSFDLAAFG